MKFCPYCGKKLSIDAPFCPYCGKKLLEDADLPKPATDNKSQTEASNTKSSAESPNKQKTYIALLLAIVMAGALFMYFSNNSATNTAKNNSSFNTSIKKQEQDDLIAKYSRPDFKFLIEKGAFKSEADVKRIIILPTEKFVKDAVKLATGKEQRLYCSQFIANYGQPNKEYIISHFYSFPDTVTYPEKDLMDYWEMDIHAVFINDKFHNIIGFPIIEHVQFNKRTSEYRTLERMGLGYLDKNTPKLLKPGESHEIKFEEKDKVFQKTAVPWKEMKSDRRRKFYELF